MANFNDVKNHLNDAFKAAPSIFRKYRDLGFDVWSNAVIDPKTTEIIAVAVTHITRCDYCIDYHTKKAISLGVEVEELIEAAVITASLQAGRILVFANDGLINEENDSAYGEKTKTFISFSQELNDYHLSKKTRVLIGLAISYALENEKYKALFLEMSQKVIISQDQIIKVQLIVAALFSGATIRHIDNIYKAFDDVSEE